MATGRPKDVRIEGDSGEVTVNLFFHTAESFKRGDTLELDVRDADTARAVSARRHQANRGKGYVGPMVDQPIVMDELDQNANEVFPGLVVRKDLLRRMRSAFGVPAFVIEFLLGKYCASTDEETINGGLGIRSRNVLVEIRQAGRARSREVGDQAAQLLTKSSTKSR